VIQTIASSALAARDPAAPDARSAADTGPTRREISDGPDLFDARHRVDRLDGRITAQQLAFCVV
jgi:hypothetical protein